MHKKFQYLFNTGLQRPEDKNLLSKFMTKMRNLIYPVNLIMMVNIFFDVYNIRYAFDSN